MNEKKYILKREREQMNGFWFYLLKWHFIYVLILLPFALLINNWGLFVSSLSSSGNISDFFVSLSLSKNAYPFYSLINGLALSISFVRWKIQESKYFRLKVKEDES